MARLIVPYTTTLLLNGSAQNFPAYPLPYNELFAILIQVPTSNANSIFIGTSTGQTIEVKPSESATLLGPKLDNGTQSYMNPDQWFVLGTNGETISFLYNPDATIITSSSVTISPGTSFNSNTHDGVGNPITSTIPTVGKRSLDVTAYQAGTWTVSVSGAVTVTGTVAATQSGVWSVGRTWTLSSGTDSVTVTGSVTISGTVAVTQSGAWNVGLIGVSYNAGATDATTLRVSANIMRDGNALDYNAGNASANTLRIIPAADSVYPAPSVPVALTVKQAAVTVGTSAVRLTTDGLAPSATRRKLQYMADPDVVGVAKFWMGSSTVTSTGGTRGTQIFPGQLIEETDDANDYYIISDTAAQTILIVEVE